MNKAEEFREEVSRNVAGLRTATDLQELSRRWITDSATHRYSYNFSWLGRPIIQYPGDIVATQELIWSVKPDLIIETGIAHGGSLILSASILELIGGKGRVLGIDIDIREHNRVDRKAPHGKTH
jgi:cephalosporin hydroxylase